MKRNKILALILALTAILAIALTGCGEESNDTEWVNKTFGDITISLPGEFQDVNQSNGVYTCAGPGGLDPGASGRQPGHYVRRYLHRHFPPLF